MLRVLSGLAFAATIMVAPVTSSQAAGWQPKGPIKLMIAFRAGGGVDTQARLIAEELNKRHGWKIIPENLAGKGGAVMARALKKEPADGLTIGMTVSEGITYSSQATRNAGYGYQDFTMLTTTTGTQMGLFAKSSRGWNSLADVIKAAKAGEKISVGAFTPKAADGTYLIGKENGVDLTIVMVKGGKGGLNGVLADDLDIAWGAGPQTKGVVAGDLAHLASAERAPLKVSPDIPLLSDFSVPYSFGAKFMFVAPKGLPDDARQTLTEAIQAVVSDPETKVNKMINKAFSGVELIAGSDLDAFIKQQADEDKALLEAASQ